MRLRNFLSFLLGASATPGAGASGFSTPEEAVLALEAAYSRKDLDGAVKAKDFREEARLMLEKLNPQFSTDSEMLRETAEVLELAFRKQIRDSGFPDFKRIKCSFVSKKTLSPNLTELREECVTPQGHKTVQDLHVTRASGGWRVVVIPK